MFCLSDPLFNRCIRYTRDTTAQSCAWRPLCRSHRPRSYRTCRMMTKFLFSHCRSSSKLFKRWTPQKPIVSSTVPSHSQRLSVVSSGDPRPFECSIRWPNSAAVLLKIQKKVQSNAQRFTFPYPLLFCRLRIEICHFWFEWALCKQSVFLWWSPYAREVIRRSITWQIHFTEESYLPRNQSHAMSSFHCLWYRERWPMHHRNWFDY